MHSLAEDFFGGFFPSHDRTGELSAQECQVLEECFAYVSGRFPRMKYILGTGLDFTLLAQQISVRSPVLKDFELGLSDTEVLTRYPLVSARGQRQANTLTLQIEGQFFGIRALEELVLNYFVRLNKPGYPSAYVYNTGQWSKYRDLLAKVFSLSNFGRFCLLERLLDFGEQQLPTVSLRVTPMPEQGPFERILGSYPRSHAGENGGLAFQAIAFGYVSVMYSHLNLIAAKVRTGSARQKRIGDIDGYVGDALAVTFEVKDFHLSEENANNEIGEFKATIDQTNVLGVVICGSHTATLEASLGCSALRLLSLASMISLVRMWDVAKQQAAVNGVIHFLANIEQSAEATERLASFIAETSAASSDRAQ